MYAYKQLNGIIPHAFINKRDQYEILTGNESVPKIMINNTTNLFFKTAVSILQISSHNSFRVLFDKIASVFEKKYLYFSIGNGQSTEPELCQLYRHTFVRLALQVQHSNQVTQFY